MFTSSNQLCSRLQGAKTLANSQLFTKYHLQSGKKKCASWAKPNVLKCHLPHNKKQADLKELSSHTVRIQITSCDLFRLQNLRRNTTSLLICMEPTVIRVIRQWKCYHCYKINLSQCWQNTWKNKSIGKSRVSFWSSCVITYTLLNLLVFQFVKWGK